MPTRSARTLVDAVTDEVARVSVRPADIDSLRAQAALVRALVDQLDSYHPEDPVVGALHDQLSDELDRLARLANAGSVTDAAGVVDVLIVDDEAGAREGMRRALKALGYPCRIAASADEALVEYERQPAAIVLSDWTMPGMSGLDLVLALKRHEPQPYIIVVTGYPEKARVEVRDSADDFLTKPVDLGDLEARLAAGSRLVRAVRLVTAVNERLRSLRPAT